jgi:hypothetical protein
VGFAREVFAEGYVRDDLRPTQARARGAGRSKVAAGFRAAFPDLTMTVDLLFGEGEFVAARWTTRGTKHGGLERPGADRELWNHRDDLGLTEQVGRPIYAGAAPEDPGSDEPG